MKKSIPFVLVTIFFCLIACTQQPTEKDSILLPVSIYDIQGELGSRAIEVEGEPLDEHGVPNEILNIYYPSFAGLGEKTVGSDSEYEMKMLSRYLTCSVSEEGDFYVIEGTCDEQDAYVYYKLAKDGSELSFVEARIVKVRISNDATVDQAIIVFSPKITNNNGVFEGHCYNIEYVTDGSKATGKNVSISNIYLYQDIDFRGLLIISEIAPITLQDIPGTEMTKENMMAIINDPAIEAIEGPTEGGHWGSIFFFRSENDFAFEAELPFQVNRTFDEYKAKATAMNPNWVI